MFTKKIFYLLPAFLVLACTNENENIGFKESNNEIILKSTIETSRSNTQATQLLKDRTVRVWLTSEGNEYINDWKLTADGNGGFSGEKKYFPENINILKGYAVHTNAPIEDGASLPETIIHSVATDQTNIENFINSDLLYSVNSSISTDEIHNKMNFYHMLSKMNIKLIPGSECTAEELKNAKISILNVKTQGTLRLDKSLENIADQEKRNTLISATGDVGSISATGNTDVYSEVAIVPQDIATGTELVNVTVGDMTYVYKVEKDKDGKFESGYQYTYEFTINKGIDKMEVSIDKSQITDWTETEIEKFPLGSYSVSFTGSSLPENLKVYNAKGTEIKEENNVYKLSDQNSFYIECDYDKSNQFVVQNNNDVIAKRTVDNNKIRYDFQNTLTNLTINYEAVQVAVGNYYNSDGSCSVYPTYGDVESIALVFKTGAGDGDDKDSYNNAIKNSGIKGYAIALNDAHEGVCKWSDSSLKDTDESIDKEKPWENGAYKGYANTKKITDNGDNFTEENYPAFYYVWNYNVTAPSESSGWYLPSLRQIHEASEIKNIETLLGIEGASFFAQDNDAKYWSSTEIDDNGNIGACFKHIVSGGNHDKWWDKKDREAHIRAILTF